MSRVAQAPGEAQEMPNEGAAMRRAEAMSRDPANAGARPCAAAIEYGLIAAHRGGDHSYCSGSRHQVEHYVGSVSTALK
jgi:hypothetical protein